MKRIEQVFETNENAPLGFYQFYCPGCKFYHMINTIPGDGPVWSFNNNFISPTISPSILVNYPTSKGNKICHSFVENGFIRFLSDCTHELAGQTIEIPNID